MMNRQSISTTVGPRATLLLGAFLALGFVIGFALAPSAEASHEYSIYKCTGSYLAKYRQGDDNAPFGDQCSTLKITASFYLIKRQDDPYSLVYLNSRTKEYGVVQDCPEWDCYGGNGGFKCAPGKLEFVFGTCDTYDIDINGDGNEDASRCEILCLQGASRDDGTKLPPPYMTAANPQFTDAPLKLSGTYCRVTCYDAINYSGDYYVEDNPGAGDYSYDGPYDNDSSNSDINAIACVTGTISGTLDKKLTSIWLDDSDDLGTGEDTVTDFLDSLGWTSAGTRDCSSTQATPYQFLSVEPFCP